MGGSGNKSKLRAQFSVSRGHCPRLPVAVPATAPMAQAKQFEKTNPTKANFGNGKINSLRRFMNNTQDFSYTKSLAQHVL
jgi:hypothetical protein